MSVNFERTFSSFHLHQKMNKNIFVFLLLHFFFDLTSFYRQGQKYNNIFVHFLVQMKTWKSPFEINWRLPISSNVFRWTMSIFFFVAVLCFSFFVTSPNWIIFGTSAFTSGYYFLTCFIIAVSVGCGVSSSGYKFRQIFWYFPFLFKME